MANWDKILSRGNVEDRRAFGPSGIGGLGIGGVLLIAALTYLGGGDVTDVLMQLQNAQVAPQNIDPAQFAGEDEYEVFASTVLGSNNEMWEDLFAQSNQTYTPPKLVLFRGATQSSCGGAQSLVGPHYCPLDETIYLDETFFDELTSRLGAEGGDVAEAYVIAHEVAHHAQNKLGIMDQARASRDNENAIKLELQADCFAGLWAHSVKDLGVFLPGEINEAMDAAAAVGDDRIQQRTTGQVNPESWTHGSSAERVAWFNRGFDTGSLASCDTFR
jgi:uncharacterized protein